VEQTERAEYLLFLKVELKTARRSSNICQMFSLSSLATQFPFHAERCRYNRPSCRGVCYQLITAVLYLSTDGFHLNLWRTRCRHTHTNKQTHTCCVFMF